MRLYIYTGNHTLANSLNTLVSANNNDKGPAGTCFYWLI